MPQMIARDGTRVDVPADQVAEAYHSGNFGFEKGARLNVVDPSGTPGTIDPGDITDALSKGYAVEPDEAVQRRALEEQYGTPGQVAKTFAEHAAGAATLGGSDVLLSQIMGDEYRQAALGRSTVNPLAAGAGDVAGTVAPLLIPGVGEEAAAADLARLGEGGVEGARALAGAAEAPGLLGRAGEAAAGLGRVAAAPMRGVSALGEGAAGLASRGLGAVGLTGESLLGRAALRGAEMSAQGAVEGALFGAGHALGETALAPGGDYDHLGERLIAGATDGAIFGGVTGGTLGTLLGGGEAAIERGAEKLGGAQGLKTLLENFGAERTMKALGARGTDLRKLGRTEEAIRDRMTAIARDVQDYTLADGQKVFRAGDKAEDIADKVVEARREVGQKLGDLRQRVDQYVEGGHPELRPDVAGVLGRIDSEVLAPLRGTPLEGRIGSVERAFRGLRPTPELPSWNAFMEDGMARGLDHATISAEYRAAKEAAIANAPPVERSLEQLTDFRKKLDELIHPKPSGPGLPPQPPAAALQLQQARAILEGEIERATGTAVDAMGDPALQGAYAKLKSQYRNLSDAAGIAGKATIQDLGNRVISMSDMQFGQAAGISEAVLHGGAGLLHGGPIGLVAGLGSSIAHKLIRERSSSLLAVMASRAARGERLVSDAVTSYVRRAGRAVEETGIAEGVRSGHAGAALPSAASASAPPRNAVDAALHRRQDEDRTKAYWRVYDRLQRRAAEADQGHFVDPSAPNASQATNDQIGRAAKYALATAPVHPGADAAGALAGRLRPSPDPVALSRWARGLDVANNPRAALRALHDGSLTLQHVEALKAVYPKTYADIQGEALQQVQDAAARGKPVPYPQRVQLHLLLGIATDPSLRPAAIQSAQAIYAPQPPAGSSVQAPPAGKTVDVASGYLTAAQKLAKGFDG